MSNVMDDVDMRTQLTDFASEFMAEVQAEQKLKEGKAYGNCSCSQERRKL
jgi:hypothetical protein